MDANADVIFFFLVIQGGTSAEGGGVQREQGHSEDESAVDTHWH